MLNTIITVITIIIMVAYFYRMVNRIYRTKSWFTEFVIVLLCLLVLTYANPDTAINSNAINDAYNKGFNDAITTAELIEVNDIDYYISFGKNIPEVHHYTFDEN